MLFSVWQLFGDTYQQLIILRGNSLSAKLYLGVNFRGSNFRGTIARGDNCPGGNCPVPITQDERINMERDEMNEVGKSIYTT